MHRPARIALVVIVMQNDFVQTAADADFDSPLMRLAAGGRTN
jgi:hypothetical protein